MKDDRYLLIRSIVLGSFLFTSSFVFGQHAYKYAPPESLKDGILTGTLKAAKLDERHIVAGISEVLKGNYSNIHSVLLFRDGALVFEEYFTGEDENNHQGRIGLVKHGRDTLHDVRSISKSVVALAVLSAHARGHIKSLDQPISDFFRDYPHRFTGKKKLITVKHLLTMTAGLDWNEDVPYSSVKSSAAMFNSASDPIDFVLSREVLDEPGIKFKYNGGLTQLLAAILKRSTGSDVERYTRDNILAPLGVTNHEWAKRRDGEPDADSGLRLRSRDIGKIGLLLFNRGRWGGKQIIPRRLIDDAISEHVSIPQEGEAAALGDRQGYGYQIWRFSFLLGGERIALIELSGNGGQKVYWDQANRLISVITAGNYDRRDLKKSSLDIFTDLIYPSIMDRRKSVSTRR